MLVRPEDGWPFWWRWVLATNLGWFPGIYLGVKLAEHLPAPPIVRAALSALIASSLFGAGQAFCAPRCLGTARQMVVVDGGRLDRRCRHRTTASGTSGAQAERPPGLNGRGFHRRWRGWSGAGLDLVRPQPALDVVASD